MHAYQSNSLYFCVGLLYFGTTADASKSTNFSLSFREDSQVETAAKRTEAPVNSSLH